VVKQHTKVPGLEQAILAAVIVKNFESLVITQATGEFDFEKIEDMSEKIHRNYEDYHQSRKIHPPAGTHGGMSR
jgi:hypothetical protein